MQPLLMGHESARAERDGWMDDNARGLALAAAADWNEAAEAFAAAADAMARRAPDARSHDALGLVLSNLAQACFRAGRTREGLAHAQRACAIRVALLGEDALPVARARMDLAVMLGSVGRLDEAQALLQRATAAVERQAGDDDARLVVMLENAARLALAAGTPANAEPLLLRLHALLGAHGMSTARADRLLGLVASARGAGVVPAAALEPVELEPVAVELAAVVEPAVVELAAVEPVMEPVRELPRDDWEYEPLQEAVALTDVLLRTTPSGVIAVTEAMQHDADVLAAFERVPAAMMEPALEPLVEPILEAVAEPVVEPVVERTERVDEAPSEDVALLADDADAIVLELADDVGGMDVAPGALPTAAETAEPVDSFGLDFALDFADESDPSDTVTSGASAGSAGPDATAGHTDLLGLDLDDALADSLVDVPTRVSPGAPPVRGADESLVLEPVTVMRSAEPAVMPPPAPAAEVRSALDAPLMHRAHAEEASTAFGFGPPPAVVSPIGQSAAAPTGAGVGTGASAERARAEREALDEVPRLRPPRGPRPTFPPEPPPSGAAGRLVLVILGTVVAAAAAGGVAWYVWLR
ncbi:MAG: tetratricopeptide repeat protein [Gemmatimonadota bacterium]|nr:tetratricopeptide repeat protein [Gemmatimonadota bacterium]MDQ8168240.1 tetratricopeptide repeat protein [Gemmatimonadota bacterium]